MNLPPDLRAALDRFKADQSTDVTDEEIAAAALREFLITCGYLPAFNMDDDEPEGKA